MHVCLIATDVLGEYIIEIDESAFGKKEKYHKGKSHTHYWVFGIVARGERKVLLKVVPDRKKETLVSIIQKHVHVTGHLTGNCMISVINMGL